MITIGKMTHAEDCAEVWISDVECKCEPSDGGEWNQPEGWAVGEATDELGDDTPWCLVHHRAFELMEAGEDG